MPDDLDRFRGIIFEDDDLEEKEAPEPDDEYVPKSTQELLDEQLSGRPKKLPAPYEDASPYDFSDKDSWLTDWFGQAYKRSEIEKKYSPSYLRGVYRRINERLTRNYERCRLRALTLTLNRFDVRYDCNRCGAGNLLQIARGALEQANGTLDEENLYAIIEYSRNQCNVCGTE